MNNYTVGALAYFDSFSGLLPCKVIKIEYEENKLNPSNELKITVKITAKNYRNGEIVVSSPTWIIPRKSVIIRSGQYRINHNFTWVVENK